MPTPPTSSPRFNIKAFCTEPKEEEYVRRLGFEKLSDFFSAPGPRYDDGSREYRLKVVKACYPEIETGLEERVDELYPEAVLNNPLLKHTWPEFYLAQVKEGDTEVSTILIPRYTQEQIQTIIMQVWLQDDTQPATSYGEEWEKAIISRAVIANDPIASLIEFNPELLYDILQSTLPGFTEMNAMEFLRKIKDNPDAELQYCRGSDGKYTLPGSLRALLYVPEGSGSLTKLVGRPDIDDMLANDLASLLRMKAELKAGKSTATILHNRNLVGGPGSGKTTAVKEYAHMAREAGILVFELGRGENGEQNNNPAAMLEKAFRQISLFATYAKEPVVLIIDDRGKMWEQTANEDFDRDDLKTTLLRMIGGIGDCPYLQIIATSNSANYDPALSTPKRFGEPILFTSAPQIQAKLIYASAERFGLTGFPLEEETLTGLLFTLPEMSNEVLLSILERAHERGRPSYEGFVREIADYMLGGRSDDFVYSLEKKHRNAFTAGLVTTALALGIEPFAAKASPTRTSLEPSIIFSLRSDTRYGLFIPILIRWLDVCTLAIIIPGNQLNGIRTIFKG
ncbi:MAG: ATP-binding protein [Nanoarchaeota archaeon]|nr:ATP-binding protein [Nanoarchaeota archaeon]